MSEPARFTTLPTEIRTIIYQHLFTNNKVIAVHPNTKHCPLDDEDNDKNEDTNENPSSPPPKYNPSTSSSILSTSHLIHQESLPHFYTHTTFTLHQCTHLNPLNTLCCSYRVLQKFKSSLPQSPLSSSSSSSSTTTHPIINTQIQTYITSLSIPPSIQNAFSTPQDLLPNFPNLQYLTISLSGDFHPSDGTNFDKAVRNNLLRYDSHKILERSLYTQAFRRQCFVKALWGWVKYGDQGSDGGIDGGVDGKYGKRKKMVEVKLDWKMDWRFLEFRGVVVLNRSSSSSSSSSSHSCDSYDNENDNNQNNNNDDDDDDVEKIEEGGDIKDDGTIILRIWDGMGISSKIYEVGQGSLDGFVPVDWESAFYGE